jgi:hypothetical protein
VPAHREFRELLLLGERLLAPGFHPPSSPAASAARTASGPCDFVTATMPTGWVQPARPWWSRIRSGPPPAVPKGPGNS